MRRKQQAERTEGGPPKDVLHFVLDDWIDRTEPIPETWRGGTDFHYFRARRKWMDHRREWCRANGMRVVDLLRMTRPPRPYDRQ